MGDIVAYKTLTGAKKQGTLPRLALVGGPLAHLVEHRVCNAGVAGSSPAGSTNCCE